MKIPKLVTIDVPEDFVENDEISEYLMACVDELMPAFDLDHGRPDDSRIQLDDVSIDDIELSSTIRIIFTAQWSANYGCTDANFETEEQRHVSGERQGNRFTFHEFVYPEPRSTWEEY